MSAPINAVAAPALAPFSQYQKTVVWLVSLALLWRLAVMLR
jgi:hypothetical protein